jgi:hypothetical protein
MFGGSSMCPGVPFIALRDLGAVGAPFWKALVAFSPQVYQIVRWQWIVQRLRNLWLGSFLFWGAPDCPVGGTGPSGAPCDRCPPGGVATSRWLAGTPDYPVLRADGPVNYSRRRLKFSRTGYSADCAPDCSVHTRVSDECESVTL